VTDITAQGDSCCHVNPAESTNRKRFIMHIPSLKSLAVVLATGVFGIGSSASASTVLLDVDGPVGGVISIAGDGSRAYVATAATFSVNQTISNAHWACRSSAGSCAGTVSLYSIPPWTPNAPPPARWKQRKPSSARPGAHRISTWAASFRCPSSLAGVTYTMILQMTSGSGAWLSSPTPAFEEPRHAGHELRHP
jgi:hypothetical protein